MHKAFEGPAITTDIPATPAVGGLDSFMGNIGGLLSPVSTGLGLASGLLGSGQRSEPDIAKAGGPFYTGDMQINRIDTGSIVTIVAVGVLLYLVLRRK
jgi:hypothetical protein